MQSVKFKYHDKLVREEDTAESMDIEDEDVIDLINLNPRNAIVVSILL